MCSLAKGLIVYALCDKIHDRLLLILFYMLHKNEDAAEVTIRPAITSFAAVTIK